MKISIEFSCLLKYLEGKEMKSWEEFKALQRAFKIINKKP